MPYASLPSARIHYSEFASGSSQIFSSSSKLDKTIVFIHGLGSSQNYYLPVIPLLTPGAQCILLDTPGSARSSLPKETPTVRSLAETVWQLLDELGVAGNVQVVGHSMGCLIALHVAQLRPTMVEKVVLLGPVYPSESMANAFSKRIATVQEGGMETMANMIPNTALGSSATYLQRAMVRELLMGQTVEGYSALCNTIATSTLGDLTEVMARVLIVAGTEDKSTPMEGCQKLREVLGRKADLTPVEGMGHWHCVERPHEIAEIMRGFL